VLPKWLVIYLVKRRDWKTLSDFLYELKKIVG